MTERSRDANVLATPVTSDGPAVAVTPRQPAVPNHVSGVEGRPHLVAAEGAAPGQHPPVLFRVGGQPHHRRTGPRPQFPGTRHRRPPLVSFVPHPPHAPILSAWIPGDKRKPPGIPGGVVV